MTAFIIAAIVAVASVLLFLRADEVRSHQSFGGLIFGLLFSAAIALSHFVGW